MNTERKIYTIDVGTMSLKDAEKVMEYYTNIMEFYRVKKIKEPSLIVKVMELIGSSGFGIQL